MVDVGGTAFDPALALSSELDWIMDTAINIPDKRHMMFTLLHGALDEGEYLALMRSLDTPGVGVVEAIQEYDRFHCLCEMIADGSVNREKLAIIAVYYKP